MQTHTSIPSGKLENFISYSKFQKLMHWSMAFLMIGMLALGFFMSSAPNDMKKYFYITHKSTGVVILVLLVIRIFGRFTQKQPPHIEGLKFPHNILSRLSPYVLYLGMATIALSGYLMSDMSGRGINFFGIFHIPPILTDFKHNAGAAHYIHVTMAWPLVGIIVLHIGAALYHHFVLKNATLKRMMPAK